MPDRLSAEALPERRLNALLRRADWRFLLAGEKAPLVANFLGGEDARAVELIAAGETADPAGADMAATGFPTRSALRAAIDAVRPGGEIVSLWRLPRPFGMARAVASMRHAGLLDVRVFWAGPLPHRAPQFWLDLGSPEAIAGLLAGRPASSLPQKALRVLWRACVRLGLLSPLCAIGRAPGAAADAPRDEIGAHFPASAGRVLLSGGKRSINKVVGLPFAPGAEGSGAVVKFARVRSADAALEREAAALRALERDRHDLPGVPRLLAEGRRAGRRALAESAVDGKPLIVALSKESFGQLSSLVGEWLVGLCGGPAQPREEWWPRLVGEPLAEFERNFGEAIAADSIAALRNQLERLGELPQACEHRDCSPWNVVLDRDGAPGLHDWESAEPRGLPGLDLAYFLANAAFVVDGALESGRTRESYVALLDPGTPRGKLATECAAAYCDRAHISSEDFARLRLLAWVVHSRSDFHHLSLEAAGRPDRKALRAATYLGLIEVELGQWS